MKQVVTSLPAALLSQDANRQKYQAFLFVPQCPQRMGWGGIAGLPAVDSLIFDSIVALEEEFPIDVARRYVSGNSLGGYGTWHLISARPEMFAAAVPICGGGNPEFAAKLVDLPIWAFHGKKDKNVPVSGSREIIQAIKNAGGNPRYTEYPDKAHDISKEVIDTPGLLDWLFAQKRI
jgi:predicted peptidase